MQVLAKYAIAYVICQEGNGSIWEKSCPPPIYLSCVYFHCWLGALEMEMSTTPLGYSCERAMFIVGGLCF